MQDKIYIRELQRMETDEESIERINKKIFNIENVENFISELKQALKYPYINIYHSTLGGNDNISILLTLSLDHKENWPGNILENTRYLKLHIFNYGKLEFISGYKKIRKISFNSINDIVIKLQKQTI